MIVFSFVSNINVIMICMSHYNANEILTCIAHIYLYRRNIKYYICIYILSDHLHFRSMIWNKLVLYFLSTRQKNVELALLGRRNQTRRKRRSAIKGDPRLSKVREKSWFPTSRFLFPSSVNEFKAIEWN